MGGARAHVVNLVPELAALAPDDQVLLDRPARPDRRAAGAAVELDAARASGRRRARFSAASPGSSACCRASPRAGGPTCCCRSAASCRCGRRARPCSKPATPCPSRSAYWQLLEREPPRLQFEEQARWLLLRASLRAASRVLVPTRAMRQDVVTRLPDLLDQSRRRAVGRCAGLSRSVRWQRARRATSCSASRSTASTRSSTCWSPRCRTCRRNGLGVRAGPDRHARRVALVAAHRGARRARWASPSRCASPATCPTRRCPTLIQAARAAGLSRPGASRSACRWPRRWRWARRPSRPTSPPAARSAATRRATTRRAIPASLAERDRRPARLPRVGHGAGRGGVRARQAHSSWRDNAVAVRARSLVEAAADERARLGPDPDARRGSEPARLPGQRRLGRRGLRRRLVLARSHRRDRPSSGRPRRPARVRVVLAPEELGARHAAVPQRVGADRRRRRTRHARAALRDRARRCPRSAAAPATT